MNSIHLQILWVTVLEQMEAVYKQKEVLHAVEYLAHVYTLIETSLQ